MQLFYRPILFSDAAIPCTPCSKSLNASGAQHHKTLRKLYYLHQEKHSRYTWSCISRALNLPTKVSAFYIFALIVTSCYNLLWKLCIRCNHCVIASRYNIWQHPVTPCKKSFGEQGVQGSSPWSSTTGLREIGGFSFSRDVDFKGFQTFSRCDFRQKTE